jgi:hypothetical protein
MHTVLVPHQHICRINQIFAKLAILGTQILGRSDCPLELRFRDLFSLFFFFFFFFNMSMQEKGGRFYKCEVKPIGNCIIESKFKPKVI